MRKRILFLDLEETVIDSFDEFKKFINIREVKSFIKINDFDEVRLYSFAIWNDDDVAKTKNFFVPRLNKLLDIQICSDILRLSDIRSVVENGERMRFEFDHEFNLMFKKDLSFMKFVQHSMKDVDVVLLDDTVQNMTIVNKDTNVQIDMVNVEAIKI